MESIRLSEKKRLVGKMKTCKRSLKRKNLERKSFKRKRTLRRKSLKRKSLKRKSLRKRLIGGEGDYDIIAHWLIVGRTSPLQAFFNSNRRNIKMKKSERYFGFGINTFNGIILQTDKPHYQNTFGEVYRLRKVHPFDRTRIGCQTNLENFVLLRLGIVSENDIPDVIPKNKSERWNRFFGKDTLHLGWGGIQYINEDGTSLTTSIAEAKNWEFPPELDKWHYDRVSRICEGNEGIDFVYIGSTEHALGFDYYLFKNKRYNRECTGRAWPYFCSKREQIHKEHLGDPKSIDIITYNNDKGPDFTYCGQLCDETPPPSIDLEPLTDIDTGLDKLMTAPIRMVSVESKDPNVNGSRDVWRVVNEEDLVNLARLGITSLECVKIDGYFYKYEIIFTNSINGRFVFTDEGGVSYTNRTFQKNIPHSIKYNSPNPQIVNVKREI